MSVCSEIVDQIKENAAVFQGRVSIARNINNPTPTALPEAWVHRWTKVAQPNDHYNFTNQLVACEIGVLVAAAVEQSDGVDNVQTAELAVRSALIDRTFEVGPDTWPLEFVRLEYVDNADAHTTFRITFRYHEYARG